MTLFKIWCKRFIILLIFSFLFLDSQAQSTVSKSLVWKYVRDSKVTQDSKKNICWFDGAMADENSTLPLYIERFDMPSGMNNVNVTILDAQYEALGQNVPADFSTRFNKLQQALVSSRVILENGKPSAVVQVNPFRISPDGGGYEKLISFKLSFSYTYVNQKSGKSWSFSSHSNLASGYWYKVGVSQNGIYKLTYSDMASMGFNVDQIDPRNIAVYGQGGKPLPENNAVYRPDDIQQNAIYVSGEADGRFDPSDYILFYAVGVDNWSYNSTNQRFAHSLNKYSTRGFYFVTVGTTAGKRLATQTSLSDPADYTCDRFPACIDHELDSVNLIKSGREFYGEVFDLSVSREFSYNLINLVPSTPVYLNSSVIARSFSSSSFDVYANGTKVLTQLISPVSADYTSIYANAPGNSTETTFLSGSSLTLRYIYNKNGSSSAIGWLNYFELNYTAWLNYPGAPISFRDPQSVGKGVTEFQVSNATGVSVWNVTDPLNVSSVSGNLSGNVLNFRLRTDSLMEFVAHAGVGYLTPTFIGVVQNQDLHGLDQYQMVILTHPDFESQASTLADFHRNHDTLSVLVVHPEQIYNEFSSGAQDPTAIRSFMKMFYDRALGNPDRRPRFLLIFGDGSYDNLDRVKDNTNFVVTYQTWSSLNPGSSWMTDDYYAFLDDTESGGYGGAMDIAVGRLPVSTVEQANNALDKIIRYESSQDLASVSASCNGFSSDISNFADWRNVLCFVADDNDKMGENFLYETENITRRLDTVFPVYNIEKIYFDAYTQVSTPGGQRYPDVNDAIIKRVQRGALIVNYIGHGGETGWAHEAVLGVSDINAWDNKNNLPLFVTATCEFSRLDDPARTSAGEYVFLNPNGGGIALFTTTRLAYTSSNAELNSRFYNYVLGNNTGAYPYLGDAVKNAKNSYGCLSSIANFLLIGDPALKLAYPRYHVVTTHINTHDVSMVQDTVRALSKVVVSGEVRDNANVKMTNFNGLLFPTIYDKRTNFSSMGNDAGPQCTFSLQKNIIYKGKASIVNGEFSFTFLVPKDIAYHYGQGKMSYYAKNTATEDAAGYFMDFTIGGTDSNAITDKEGPEINLYLNNEKFVSGGITNPNPYLYAKVSDSGGINTVGSGIGHDIAAVLDNNTDDTYVLNDYYEADLNTYQSGMLRYPFKDLETGSHSLRLKVWDVFNNSSERSIDFVVADDAALALDHVLNYPNPFTTYTEFWFEHNKPCCGLDVQVQIFTVTGKLVKTIDTWVQTNGYKADPIPWDGLDEYGDPIAKGVYIYKLRVKDSEGNYAEKLEKLVILR
jgi:hypothetical protein